MILLVQWHSPDSPETEGYRVLEKPERQRIYRRMREEGWALRSDWPDLTDVLIGKSQASPSTFVEAEVTETVIIEARPDLAAREQGQRVIQFNLWVKA